MKKTIVLLLSVLMALSLFAACTPKETTPSGDTSSAPQTSKAASTTTEAAGPKVTGKVIGNIIPGPDVYYTFAKSGCQWAVEASGNTYVERNSENNTVKEIQNVEDLISAQVDAIILMTTSPETGQKGVKLANDADIPIFLIDCEIEEGAGKAQGQVTNDQLEIGAMMGRWLVENNINVGDYVVIGGLAGQSGTALQLQGFQDAIAGKLNEHLLSDVQYADWDRAKGEEVMRNYLVMHDHIDTVYAMNEEMAYGARVAIEEAGRQDEMKIYSANGSATGKGMLEAGTLAATVGWSCSENGILITLKVLQYFDGSLVDYRTVTPLAVYTIDNIADYSDWDVSVQSAKYEPILRDLGFIA